MGGCVVGWALVSVRKRVGVGDDYIAQDGHTHILHTHTFTPTNTHPHIHIPTYIYTHTHFFVTHNQ
jgi:hypothetical protein